MSVEMVTAYNQCTAPTLTHRPSLAFPACVPVRVVGQQPGQRLRVRPEERQARRLGEHHDSGRQGRREASVAKSKSIWKNGAPYSGNDLSGTAIVRATDNGCGPVRHRLHDHRFPASHTVTCTNGFCKLAPLAFPALIVTDPPIHPGDATNLDIGQIAILDEDGDAVARGGLFVL